MSTGEQHPWNEAATKAAAFTKFISDVAGPLRVCGSLRRHKPTVGDIEIVTCPPNRAALLARLDTLVRTGMAEKAIYDNGTYRWGDTYRGLDFMDMRIEIFAATPQNVGYITWLRTGPGDANTYVMQNLGGWPIYFNAGMAWHVGYEDKLKVLKSKLRVPDELTLFHLLGISDTALIAAFGTTKAGAPQFPPEQRTVTAYQRLLKKTRPSVDFIETLKIVEHTPKTLSLF